MDLREVQKLLDEDRNLDEDPNLDDDPNLDEDQTDMLKAAACLLAVAETAMAKARERRIRRERKSVCERMALGETQVWHVW